MKEIRHNCSKSGTAKENFQNPRKHPPLASKREKRNDHRTDEKKIQGQRIRRNLLLQNRPYQSELVIADRRGV